MSPGARRALLAAAALLLAASASAAEDAFEFYKEEAQVVTASRRAEPALSAPAAVDVVTAEDIRAYGFASLWDALRFRPGMDVVDGRSLDGNRALVSARGFNGEFVSEMQVLVDGRSVYSPFLGGVYWADLPVPMDDIERIEIVRGPNAALYGSNAALGVINIITKKPGSAPSASASLRGGSREALGASASVEDGDERRGLRVSWGYGDDDGHPAGSGASSASDFFHRNKLNARGRWSPSPGTEVELFTGASWLDAGLPGLSPDAQTRHMSDFQALRATRVLGGGSWEATLSRAELSFENQPLYAGDVSVRTYQYEAGLLRRFSWLDGRAQASVGGEGRLFGADSDQAFVGDPRQSSRLVRGYVQQSTRLSGALTLAAGVSVEHSGTGGTQPAWQAALIAAPRPEQSVRLSYSYAPTIPPLFQERANYDLSAQQRYVGNPAFGPEKLSSWELGWSGLLRGGRLKPGVSLYYMDVRDLGYLTATSGTPAILTTSNADRALARGAELSLDWTPARGLSAFANWTYESVTHAKGPSANGQDVSRATPAHMVNVGARAALPHGVGVSALLGYKDAYLTNSDSRGLTGAIPRHFRLDARVSWSPRPGLELYVAGRELLQPAFTEYVDATATPRTVEGGLRARFAP
ncbi:MAG: TonB-dependent receptor [Elusimicrobia bacterium]|nr:TonB-dependent receptor [Elusimicrobiota bacterium]